MLWGNKLLFCVFSWIVDFAGQTVAGYEKETKDDLVKRNSEYLAVIRENINHSQIKKVIIFYTNEDSLKVGEL